MSTHEYRLEHFRTRILHGVEFDSKKGIKFVQLVTKTRSGVSKMKVSVEDNGNNDFPRDGSEAERLVWKVENGRLKLPAILLVSGWVLCQAISIKGSAIIMTNFDLGTVTTEQQTEESHGSSSRANVIERMSSVTKRPLPIDLDEDDRSMEDEEDDEEPLADRRKRRQVLATVDVNISPDTPRPKNRGPSQAGPGLDKASPEKTGPDNTAADKGTADKVTADKAAAEKVGTEKGKQPKPRGNRSARNKEQEANEAGDHV
ncbi:unnamed protein product [Mortierella alpina]